MSRGSAWHLYPPLTSLHLSLPRWPAATAPGLAPSPTPTLLLAPTTSEGLARTVGGCREEGLAAAPCSRGASPVPGSIPRRCCSAPRRGQQEPTGSGAAGSVRTAELDEQRFGGEGRVPCTPPYTPPPKALHSLGFATLLRAVGVGPSLCPSALAPGGAIALSVMLFPINTDLQGVSTGSAWQGSRVAGKQGGRGAGWQGLAPGIFIAFHNKRMGAVGAALSLGAL